MKNHLLSTSQQTIWNNYQKMRLRLSERLNRELSQKTGLSEADYEILFALTETKDDSVRALALRCGLEWEKSRLSHQLKRMEARGLISKEECLEDNRGTVIRLSETGRQLAAEAKQCYEAAVQHYVMDILSAEQLAMLGSIAETILSQLEESHKP